MKGCVPFALRIPLFLRAQQLLQKVLLSKWLFVFVLYEFAALKALRAGDILSQLSLSRKDRFSTVFSFFEHG